MSGNAPLGSAVFDRLQAEYETDWLPRVFVEPPGFHALQGERSILVIGDEGSGRTALCKQLIHLAGVEEKGPLVVEWQPSFSPMAGGGLDTYRISMQQIFDQIARSMVLGIGRQPGRLQKASAWVQETAIWFVQSHLQENRRRFLARLEEDATPESLTALRSLLTGQVDAIFAPDAPERLIIAEVADIVQRLGWSGIWLLVDGLESWLPIEADLMTRTLDSLLSTLELFEVPGFALKLMAPRALEPVLMQSGGVSRNRIAVMHLHWPEADLRALVEARLALASGRDRFALQELYAEDILLSWLNDYGGDLPRGWLELLRPVADRYFADGVQKPLAQSDWERIQKRHPPRLRIDLRTERVYLGYKELDDISPIPFQILRYLYQHPQRRCSREELYYRAYLRLPAVPRTRDDENWSAPTEWRSWSDTTLSRLRTSIEPDPSHPVYVVTERGKGIGLRNAF